jgi:hypothetical protein
MSSLVRTLKDVSQKVEIGVFHDEVPTAGPKHRFTIDVSEDMVAVGGGAIASADPGALITASHPNDELTGWTVASTDHTVPDNHQLQGWAFGLKIAGLDRQKLIQQIEVVTETSNSANHPEQKSSLPDTHVLISGGFLIIPHDKANLGTASFPEFERGWRSASKDHATMSPAKIQSFAIGIKQVLGREIGRIVVGVNSAESGLSSRPRARALLNDDFALTGIGALVRWTEPGSLIWQLAPFLIDEQGNKVQGVDAASKDHLMPSKARIQAWALGIRLNVDPCI